MPFHQKYAMPFHQPDGREAAMQRPLSFCPSLYCYKEELGFHGRKFKFSIN